MASAAPRPTRKTPPKSAPEHPLRAWRRAQRPRWWTQSLLASLAGVTTWHVCQLERGKPVTREAVERIAKFTGLSMDDLIRGEE